MSSQRTLPTVDYRLSTIDCFSNHIPRRPALFIQHLIGVGVAHELFLLSIPPQFPADPQRDVGNEASAGGAVSGFDIGVRLFSRPHAVEEIDHMGLVLG